MSDIQEEIKEILEIFKKINEEYSVDTELDFEDYEIPNIYLKQFLDYITNSQEENKKLKDLCDKYEEEHNTTFIEWQKDINIIDELEKYLKKQMEYYKLDTDYYVEYKLTLDKLNELKGDNK